MMFKDVNSCLQVNVVCVEKGSGSLVVQRDLFKFFDKYSCLFGCNFIFKSTKLPCLRNNTLHRIQINMFNFKIRHLNNDLYHQLCSIECPMHGQLHIQ
jgi:hypothetical protein